MTRTYQRKTAQLASDRHVRVCYERRDDIDVEKVAEVLIRVALRAASDDTATGRAGDYLRRLLTSGR